MIIRPFVVYYIVTLFVAASCNANDPDDRAEVADTGIQNHEKLEQLKLEASRLRGGGSIRSVTMDSTTASINYVANFREYKQLNPQSSLSEQDLKAYWESGDAVKKALVDGSVRIMKKMAYIDQVNITLPFQKKTYYISVSKDALEEFIGHDFEALIVDWDKKFSNTYVYDHIGRKKFFNRFGTLR